MATDKSLSGLSAIPSVVAADKIEVLDVSNTTNQATGENTIATMTQIAAAIAAINGGGSPFVGAGAGHAAGQVPDPGATAHGTPYVLGDDGAFHPMLGSGLSYSGGGYTFSGGTGGSGTVTQITAVAPLTGGVITATGSIGLGVVPVANGGLNLSALPSANQILGVNVGGTAYEGKTLTPGANVTITPSAGALTIAASGGGSGRTPIFSVATIGNLVTGVTPASIFQSPFTPIGSRTIAANRLAAGSQIICLLFGDLVIAAGDTVTFTVKIGTNTILTATSSPAASAIVSPGVQWMLRDFIHSMLTAGSAGGSRGNATLVAFQTANTTLLAANLTTSGNGLASANVPINTTIANDFDILVNFSSATVTNTCRVLGGAVFIDG